MFLHRLNRFAEFPIYISGSCQNSDLDSDDSETDGFVEHSYEVLFVPDDDIQQVSVRLQWHDNIKGIYLKASMVMVAVRGGCVCVGWWVVRTNFFCFGGGYCLFFQPPPPPDNYCTVPNTKMPHIHKVESFTPFCQP